MLSAASLAVPVWTRPAFSASVQALRVSRSLRSHRFVAMAATASGSPIKAIVKGNPNTNTLGDCPFCHRVLLTLEAKHLPYSLEYIDFDHKPSWLQEVSGGKVPVIKEDGADYMADSDKIVAFLEDKYPDPSLKSEVPAEIGSKLLPAFRGYLTSSPAEEEEKKQALHAELQSMNDYLAQTRGPLFGGNTINATDAAVAPKLYHCIVALKHFKNWELPSNLEAMQRYWKTITSLPEWKHTEYTHDSIIAGWKKHMGH